MKSKFIIILILIILLVLTLYKLFFGSLFFLPPNITCYVEGGKMVHEGFRGQYCRKTYKDIGNKCFSNKECLSNKCTLSTGWTNIKKIQNQLINNKLPQNILGICSGDNQSPCFTGEITIDDLRTAIFPPVCD